MSQYLEPFVQIKFEILFGGASYETTSPASTFAMSDGLADGTAGGEEEEIDVRVYLTDNAEVDIKMQV